MKEARNPPRLPPGKTAAERRRERPDRFMRWFDDFRNRQRETHAWVPFDEIAKWFARVNGRKDPDLYREAYRELMQALQNRAFDRNGRCSVHYVWHDTKTVPMERAGPELVDEMKMYSNLNDQVEWEHAVHEYLTPCWVPREVLLKWCGSINLRPHQNWIDDGGAQYAKGVVEKEHSVMWHTRPVFLRESQ